MTIEVKACKQIGKKNKNAVSYKCFIKYPERFSGFLVGFFFCVYFFSVKPSVFNYSFYR
jgi:hypothetical protein